MIDLWPFSQKNETEWMEKWAQYIKTLAYGIHSQILQSTKLEFWWCSLPQQILALLKS
jgi:hypothetical protein